ncbi:helix-turn-helix transcriptional regulator [Clostridium sp.]|uniref:helix-turn-helix domain-containing protein n=1 Tax=Clostridium sp. TaxID=1506 RepID=UPI002583124D|nr:helix-turn-helix transcriptional regulator [Clostridium sp.]MCI6140247.1 helix-turn-helix domain-containing protein [Clostridium sp.]
MLTYDTIKMLCKKKGVTITGTEKELGFSRGSLCKVDTSKPSMEKVQKLADYFDVSVDYLMTGKETPENREITLTARDSREITKILDDTRKQLLSQEGLMFDGDPASPEAIESIISAMQIGMELAKKKNKEKYTPKKYKKE